MNYVLDLLDDADIDLILNESHKLLVDSGGKLGLCSICDGSPVMSAWAAVWEDNPFLVGGCRPLDLTAKLQTSGWTLEAVERVEVLGYVSQIIVATPASVSDSGP